MKYVKLSALTIVLAMLANTVFAQATQAKAKTQTPAAKAAKAPAAPKSVPATVIVEEGEVVGGVDAGLNSGLERFLGVPLEITTVNRTDALNDPKYAGLNLDYMPLYLLSRTPLTEEKFGEHIKQGYIPSTADFLIFEKQTRFGIHTGLPRKPNTLEVFVMAQCPYGAQAEGKIIDAQKLGRIGKDIKIDVKYIVSVNGDSFRSLHGNAEWEEAVRQLIIKDKYPNKFWKYLEIRNKDYQSSRWDVAAEEAGINPKIFRKEWKRGVELLKKDAEYSNKMGANASPTFLWEGRVVTDINGLASIPGLEGIAQASYGGNAQAAAPAGSC
jgi:hypothetical protein